MALGDRDAAALDRLADELGDRAAALAGDVTDSAHVRALVALAVERFGGLDVAFANAGVFGVVAPVTEYPEDVFDQVMAVNVRGSFLLARHALAAMRDGGSLIINSSVVGLTSDPGICAYATSKHALVGLMRTAAKEVAARGIRVNTLHPGPGRQRVPGGDRGDRHRRTARARRRDLRAHDPAGRHARPEEVAARGAVPGRR